MSNSIPTQLRFPPFAGFTVRADFEGGALSSDFGPLLLRGVDQQIGLVHRLAQAIDDRRHASYIDHSLSDLLTQRIFQIACGYADANDANTLRRDPMFKLGTERKPLEPEQDLASAPTFSRLENAVNTRDLYRLAEAFVEQFVASYAKPPEMIVLDMDHSEDQTHGQQELAFYNHHYQSHCYLPLFLFEGLSGKFITAALRPGKRPTGAENAMILKRVLKRLRQHWPETRILLRGDAHFANVELMQLALDDPYTDFLFGLAGNSRLKKLAEPHLQSTRRLHDTRCHNARLAEQAPPQRSRTFHEIDYQARSWPQAFRTVLKAETMALGDNPASSSPPWKSQPRKYCTPSCIASWPATAPRIAALRPTTCACFSPAPPMCCITPCAPNCCKAPSCPRPSPRRSSSSCSSWPYGWCSTKTASSSTCQVAARSRPFCTQSPNGYIACLGPG